MQIQGENLKVHWAVLQAKPGKMSDMLAISARTVAKFTPNEKGSYALYGAISRENPDLMRILEVYESEDAYQIHRNSEGFKAFLTERAPILESLKILPVDPIILEQKAEGVGTCAAMTLLEVKPEKLSEFNALMSQEISRAVVEVPGVMAIFATSEQDARKNFVHVLEVYTDETARKNYLSSENYSSYRQAADNFIISRKIFENLPAKIILSRKGLC